MAYVIIRERIRTARKIYVCAACEWILNWYTFNEVIDDYKLSFTERRMLAKAKAEDYRVLPGTKYIEQVGICNGLFYRNQSRYDIAKLVLKYDMVPEP